MEVKSILSGYSTDALLEELARRGARSHTVLDRFVTWQLLDELDNREGIESVAIETGGRMTIEVKGPAVAYFVDQRASLDEDEPNAFMDVVDEVYDEDEGELFDELEERRHDRSENRVRWTVSEGAEHLKERD